jgi:hypothetical protein
MRISEILFYQDDDPSKEHRSDPQPILPPAPYSNDLTNLAKNAFTRRGLVKHGWEGQPSEPAPHDAGTELIPSGTLEPTTASWEAEPVETEPSVGSASAFPFRQHRGISGD